MARYSPGSRCTVLYRLGFNGVEGSQRWPELVVAKTYHGDKGRVAWDGMRAVWDSPLSRGDPVHVAEPLAFVPELNVLIQGPVREEQTLKQLIVEAWRTGAPAARARLDTAVAQAADGLATLHGCGAAAAVTVTWDDELADVRQALGRLRNAIPALPATLEPLLVELAATGRSLPGRSRRSRPPQLPPGPGAAVRAGRVDHRLRRVLSRRARARRRAVPLDRARHRAQRAHRRRRPAER